MKKLLFTITSVLFLLIAACSKKEDIINPTLSIEKDTYEFLNTDVTGSISITSNVDWQVTSDQGWCKVERKDDKIIVSFDHNETMTSRSAKLTVRTIVGGLTEQITVVQNGDTPTLIVDKNELIIPGKGGEEFIEVNSNLEWIVSSEKDWVKVTKEQDRIDIVVESNSEANERNATIVIKGKDSDIERVITISQALLSVEIDKSSFDFSVEGGVEEVTVTSDIDWSVSSNANWAKAVKDENKIKLTIIENENAAREAEITVTAGASKIVIDVKQAGLSELEMDKKALIAIYNSMGGGSWTVKWNIDQPLLVRNNAENWEGVTVALVDGIERVTQLSLIGKGLNGPLPIEIGNLSELGLINFANNSGITGSLPATIGKLSKLYAISIQRSQLEGTIPVEILNCKMLNTILLHNTPSLSGPLPDLSTLPLLHTLEIQNCNFTGMLSAGLGDINFNKLDLSGNKLTGEIPDNLLTKLLANPTWNICPQQAGFGFSNCP